MLNILQICTSNSWGGMEMHVGFLARQLHARGHQVTTVCAPHSPLAQELSASGFTPLLLPRGNYVQPHSVARLRQWLQKHAIEIVHSHYSRDLWSIVPALARNEFGARVPLLLTKHIGTGRPKRDFLHRWLYRRVDYAIAISEVIRQNLIATHPLSSEKVGVIHHGIDLRNFSPARISNRSLRSELGFSQNEVLVGMVGRLQVSKGCLEFLEMARRVHQAEPRTRFLIVGEPTRGEPRDAELIRARQRELELENIVTFLGYRKDIPTVLAALDVFVFPSHAEAFGLALLEAMAAGKAVIASNNDGILDLVAHEDLGMLVPPRNVATLTAACLHLVRNEDLRQSLGTAARAFVLREFSVEHMLDKIETLYYRLRALRHVNMAKPQEFPAPSFAARD